MYRRSFILSFCLLLIALIIYGIVVMGKARKKVEYESIDSFVKFFERGEHVGLKIYYIPWLAETFTPVSEDELISQNPYIIVVGNTPFAYSTNIKSLLCNYTPKKMDISRLNFRYSCIFQVGPNKVTQFSLAYGKPITLVINGQPYEASSEIVDALIKFLPVKEYLQMRKDLENSGFFNAPPKLEQNDVVSVK